MSFLSNYSVNRKAQGFLTFVLNLIINFGLDEINMNIELDVDEAKT